MDNLSVLVIDDEEGMCRLLGSILKEDGHSAVSMTSATKALQTLKHQMFDIAIVDIKMPDMNGIEFLTKAREIYPDMDIIMITAYGSIENAVEAIKLGAFNYITKPFQADEIRLALEKITERKELKKENIRLKKEIEDLQAGNRIIARSRSMQDIIKYAAKAADSNLSVLITGESGTGKEVLANYIHRMSPRKDMPFVPVQCGLLPESLLESELFGFKKGSFTGANEDRAGLFEQADNGTIFLDEIGDIDTGVQGKLLRFLQDHEIRRIGEKKSKALDVRMICATNKNLELLIKEKTFREDLYFRIKVISMHLPPLRERREDIPLLVHFFLEEANKNRRKAVEADREAVSALTGYDWPGNVRELKNCIDSASIFCDNNRITAKDINRYLFNDVRKAVDTGLSFQQSKARAVEDFEKNYVMKMLEKHKGNIAAASRESGMDRKNFFVIMKKLGITADEFKE